MLYANNLNSVIKLWQSLEPKLIITIQRLSCKVKHKRCQYPDRTMPKISKMTMGIGWVWEILKDNTIRILLILAARIVRFLEKKTKK